MEWSNDICLSFINDIENFTILWDPTDPYYKILRRKNDAWECLRLKYETTAEELKKKWQSLQASYRREKSKEIAHLKMGISEKYNSSWFAFNAMEFLGERYTPRSTRSTTMISQISENNNEFERVDVQQDDLVASVSTSKRMRTKQFTSQKSIPNKRQKDDARINESYTPKTTVAEITKDKDETEAYGEYVASTLKNLDNHSRIVAKHYINQILFDAELGKYKNAFPEETFTSTSDPLFVLESSIKLPKS